jgi:hypothetical protein
MKKICFLSFILSFTTGVFAQCKQNELDELPTIYSKGYETSFKSSALQDKLMTTIFSTVIEPALKSTKGLRGKWKPMGGFAKTPEGFINSTIEMYMNLLECRANKLQEAHERGLIINFTLNDFISKSNLAGPCSHEEDKWKNADETEKETMPDLVDGKQIYFLQPATETTFYPDVSFYKKTEDAEYFLLSKPNIPLFIPLTLKQALEINKKNNARAQEFNKQQLLMPSLKPATKADYEKKMSKEFAEYRRSFPNPEKFIADLIDGQEKLKPDMIKGIQSFIDFYSKSLMVVTEYLNITPADELAKPCVANNGFLTQPFQNLAEIKSSVSYSSKKNGLFVILNPDYFNKTISKEAPQFISIELRIQGGNATELRASKAFKTNLDFKKLKELLAK